MKAVGYIRVSTSDQAEDGVSLSNQRKRIESFCDAKEWELIQIYQDEKSGADLKRPGIGRLMADCKAKNFDVVVIYRLDRLTRSVKDLGGLIDLFDKAGVSFSSVNDNFDTTTANGRLVLNILGTVAQWERDIISERTRDALAHKRSEREIYSPLPLGYEAGQDGRLIENQAEMRVVRMIRRLREGGLSLQKIADRLNGGGVPTKNGGRWYKSTIAKILGNPIYV